MEIPYGIARITHNNIDASHWVPSSVRYLSFGNRKTATQRGVDKNIRHKEHYVADGKIPGDPAMQNTKAPQDKASDLDIRTRVLNSKSKLNTAAGSYAKNLGILHQGKRVLDLNLFFGRRKLVKQSGQIFEQ